MPIKYFENRVIYKKDAIFNKCLTIFQQFVCLLFRVIHEIRMHISIKNRNLCTNVACHENKSFWKNKFSGSVAKSTNLTNLLRIQRRLSIIGWEKGFIKNSERELHFDHIDSTG